MAQHLGWWDKFSEKASIDAIDRYRKKSIFYFVSFSGAAVILYFSAKSYQSYDISLAFTLLFGAVFILLNAVTAIIFNREEIHYYASVFCVFFMLLTVVYMGGYKNTALYWLYPIPLIYFVLLGIKIGAIVNVLFFIILLVLLKSPLDIPAQYPPAEVSRFITSFAVMNLISFIADYFRHDSHSKLTKLSYAKLKQSYTDSLTKLPNRRFLSSVLFERFMVSDEYYPLTIVNIDIDHFKDVNDTFGHQIGDQVLMKFTELCINNIRKNDVMVRTGGEEFLLFFMQTSKAQGATLAEKLRKIIEQSPLVLENQIIEFTASFGVAECQSNDDLELALHIADKRMYAAKQSGRNKVVCDD